MILFFIFATDTGEVYYKSDILKYLWKDKIILLIGNAEVKTDEIFAKAETIKYDIEKGLVFAHGNWGDSANRPVIWVGKERQKIDGAKMCYDIKTQEGSILNGNTKIEKGWFLGKKIRRVGKNALNIEGGRFTTCDHNPSHYYFWGNQLKVYVDDMVYVRPLILTIWRIPMFIAPFWWFPIKKGRKSGLLAPKIGEAYNKGKYIENIAYYWVINKNSDATFTLDYYEKLGKRFLFECRWLFPNISNGQLNSSYIKQAKTKERWAIDFFHTQKFSKTLSLRSVGKFISDAEYLVDYEEERLIQLDKIFDSYISLSKVWNISTLNFLVQERRDLGLKTVKRTIPNISYSINPQKIFLGYLSYSGYFTNGFIDTLYKQTFYNNLSFSMPFKLFKYLFISPATNHTFTYTQPEKVKKFYIPTYSISLSTNIYGKTIFKPEIRHTITPRIFYSLVDTTKNLSFGLGNEFYLVERKINLARINLSSSWNFLYDRIEPIIISMVSAPFSFINLQAYGRYNTQDGKRFNIDRIILGTHFSFSDTILGILLAFLPQINYSYVPNYDKSLWGGAELKIKKHKISLSRRYDLINNKMIDQSFYVYCDLHCWEAIFNFDKYGDRWRYDFKLQIKAIPEIKIGKGIFGFLF